MSELTGKLGPLLDELIEAHETLLGAAVSHRAAIARADAAAMGESADRQAGELARIAALDHRRRQLSAPFATRDHGAKGPTIRDLAANLDEPERSGVIERADRLRGLVERVRREHGTVRAAAESLVAHMEGLMRQVARRLSHAGTYGPGGVVGPDRVVSGIDLTH